MNALVYIHTSSIGLEGGVAGTFMLVYTADIVEYFSNKPPHGRCTARTQPRAAINPRLTSMKWRTQKRTTRSASNERYIRVHNLCACVRTCVTVVYVCDL